MKINNYKELFQALLDGKKLRLKNSDIKQCFYMNNEGQLIYSDENTLQILDGLNFTNEGIKSIEEYVKEN